MSQLTFVDDSTNAWRSKFATSLDDDKDDASEGYSRAGKQHSSCTLNNNNNNSNIIISQTPFKVTTTSALRRPNLKRNDKLLI